MSESAALVYDPDAEPVGAGDLYEVVNGRVVEPPPMGLYESWVANALHTAIGVHFQAHGPRGRSGVELLFLLSREPHLQRRPDLAYVSFERWPEDRPVPWTAAWEVVPDLAVEVVSPGDLALEVLDKLLDYFQAGARQVWVLYPRQGYALVYDSPTRITALDATGELDGRDVIPGLKLRLDKVFSKPP
jgi:Uma2 family endonuclease